MKIETYCTQVARTDVTAKNPESRQILFLGLIGEIGSLLSEMKKTLREGRENRLHVRNRLIEEMGDVLWYVTAISLSCGLNLRFQVIKSNVERIQDIHTDSNQPIAPLLVDLGDGGGEVAKRLSLFPNGLPVTFDDYQAVALMTLKDNYRNRKDLVISELIRKAAQVMKSISQLINTGQSAAELERGLGSILWYLAVIAAVEDITLSEVASYNTDKTSDRWYFEGAPHTPLPDLHDQKSEQFPRKMVFTFRAEGKDTAVMIFEETGVQVGDRLTDNAYDEDGYRFHDAFHLAFIAILGWSPVMRDLLKGVRDIKRRSKPEKDEVEDGARARIVEEAIAKIVHSHAKEVDEERLLSEKKTVSTDLLKQIQIFTKGLEVDIKKPWEWEKAIIAGCQIYLALKENNGGRVKLDLNKRHIEFHRLS